MSPELRELYQILEVDFHPLRITAKVEPILAKLQASPETSRYVEPLKNVVLSRIFEQLAQAYDSIRLSRIVKLATFKDEVETGPVGFAGADARIERFITEACRRGELSVRLDHADGIVEFEDRLFETGDVSSELTVQIKAGAASAGNSAADILQPLPSTLLQTHLTRLAQSLYASLDIVAPQSSGLAIAQANAEKAMKALSANLSTEREAILSRRLITEQRKQRAEADYMRREKEAEAARATAKREHEAREARRVEQEARARQLEIIRKNNDAVKAEEAKKLAEKLRSAGALKVADKDIENLDTAALMRIQVEQLEKTRKEMAEKLRVIGKRIDHTERAFRREEIPLLKLDYDLQQKRDREIYMAAHAQRVEHLRTAHAQDVKIKARLGDILPDFERFKVEKTSAVRAEYEKKLQKSVKKIAEEKEKRKTEVEGRRKAAQEKREREAAEAKAAREAERLREEQEEERMEAERVAKAEEEERAADAKRKEAEEREARLAEAREQRSKMDEQARKQREREAEVERRLAEKEAAKKAGREQQLVSCVSCTKANQTYFRQLLRALRSQTVPYPPQTRLAGDRKSRASRQAVGERERQRGRLQVAVQSTAPGVQPPSRRLLRRMAPSPAPKVQLLMELLQASALVCNWRHVLHRLLSRTEHGVGLLRPKRQHRLQRRPLRLLPRSSQQALRLQCERMRMARQMR